MAGAVPAGLARGLQGGLAARGMSPGFALGYAEMFAAKDSGLDDAESRTPANSTPTSFREWCETVLKPTILG
ncbi:hypothetical protein [Ensifer aridi]|uniref:hypothetical protein n=1 Tax=Ensifer aridi TaxID=1708715 RepID=UPI00111C587B|nr:hypothetical protein [Ensifer aridi]